ncbi:TetR family transcriptional regulator [Mycolicibacterium boenickei]|nr:TetR family transcriptional regulator [Mycolicibacterium boenickei]
MADRARIITAAREGFTELGHDAATFAEIGVRSGVGRPSINHHFGTKAALYQDVVAQTASALIGAGAARAHQRSPGENPGASFRFADPRQRCCRRCAAAVRH